MRSIGVDWGKPQSRETLFLSRRPQNRTTSVAIPTLSVVMSLMATTMR
jgi:hypothetical protein